MTRVAGAVAVVTGASSGIGRAVAVRLAAGGARVFGVGRDAGRLAAVESITAVAADLGEPGAPAEIADRVRSAAGRVDILVNNAGAGWAGRFAGIPHATIDDLLSVNLRAPLLLTRLLLPDMIRGGGGHLAFVGSIAGRLGVADEAVYAATKAGLDAFAGSLRQELAGTGVAVSVTIPGVVQTAFFERRGRPYTRSSPRPLPAERVAAALLSAVERDRAEAYLPRWLRVPVMVHALFPSAYRRLAGRFG